MGRTIAEKMAGILGIDFLDRDIVTETAKRMQHPVSVVSSEEENTGRYLLRKKYPFNAGIYNITDEIFYVQQNIIRDAAKKGPCIIVGRCADSILRDYKNTLNVYIYAPFEKRLRNCIDELRMEEKSAARTIREIDRARLNYQKKYCPEVTSIFDHKDIMLDSSRFEFDEAAEILANIVRLRWHNE